jgi:large subunit ribosomal protein L30
MAAKRAAAAGTPSDPTTGARLKVTQTRSTISHIARNRATVKALGLHGIGSTSIVADNAATRGMVRQVRFLVTVEEIADPAGAPSRDHKEKA